jgi:hypothetical protein
MPLLRNLDEEEQRIFLHKIRNESRTGDDFYENGILAEITL